jgi:hypothetical protein
MSHHLFAQAIIVMLELIHKRPSLLCTTEIQDKNHQTPGAQKTPSISQATYHGDQASSSHQ